MSYFDDILNRIKGVESSGNPLAQNPRSTAGGLFQFTDSTWANVLKRMNPDQYGNMSQSDLNALKKDPNIQSAAANFHISNDVAPTLSQAGLPVTPGNAYLGWFLGPQGATKALTADPSAKVADLFPNTVGPNAGIKFNGKSYGDWTIGDAKAWADSKMGGANAGANATSNSFLQGGMNGFQDRNTTGLPTPSMTTNPQQSVGDVAAATNIPDTKQPQFNYAGLASQGMGLMAAGAPKQTWQPGAPAPVHRPQDYANIFGGLLGNSMYG
jgi:Transglycosylase SLT domain